MDKRIITTIRENTRSGAKGVKFNDLYDQIDEQGHVAKSTFNLHLHVLVDNGLVKNSEKSIGKPVYYSMSEKYRNLTKLDLLNTVLKQRERRRTATKSYGKSLLHHLLFYLWSRAPPQYRILTESAFEKKLQLIDLKKSELKIDRKFRSKEAPYCFKNIYYFDLNITKYKDIPIKCLDNKERQILIRREDHLFYPLKNRSRNLFTIEQINEANKVERTKSYKGFVYYMVFPGVAVSDVFYTKRTVFRHHKFRMRDMQEIFDSLEKSKIIAPICSINNEYRYVLIDEQLRKMLLEYWTLFDFVTGKMIRIWKYFRKPTNEERKWFGILYSDYLSEDQFRTFYESRKRLKNLSEQARNLLINEARKTILTYHQMIPQEFKKIEKDFSAILDKHKELLLFNIKDILYPPFIENEDLSYLKK